MDFYWEQSIIMLPDNVQMVMLSATIGEKEQFAGWIERIKNKKVDYEGAYVTLKSITIYFDDWVNRGCYLRKLICLVVY